MPFQQGRKTIRHRNDHDRIGQGLYVEVQSRLNSGYAQANAIERLPSGEQAFRFMLNEDAMASEKLSEGIRAFVTDARKLDVLIEAQR